MSGTDRVDGYSCHNTQRRSSLHPSWDHTRFVYEAQVEFLWNLTPTAGPLPRTRPPLPTDTYPTLLGLVIARTVVDEQRVSCQNKKNISSIIGLSNAEEEKDDDDADAIGYFILFSI